MRMNKDVSQKMKTYIFILLTVSVLSALTAFNPDLAAQRDELLPLMNYEPFAYALYLATGFAILFSFAYSLPTAIAEKFIAPFSATLTGWGLGLTIAELVYLNFQNVVIGLLLTVIMFIFTMTPVWLTMQVITMAKKVRDQWFAKKRAVWAVNVIGLFFVVSGLLGFWQKYGG